VPSISAAKGRGPALASASAALATLKQLRAMWESLKGLNAKDLFGSGGGGGGGKKASSFLTDLMNWYKILQRIAKLEEDITH